MEISTLEDLTIPILSFDELGCLMKCIEFSVLTLVSSDLSITLILYLFLSKSFPLTRVEPVISTFFGVKILITLRLLVTDFFEKMLTLLTGYDNGLDLPWFTLSWFTLSIFKCRYFFFTASAINAALFSNKELAVSVSSELLSLKPLKLGLL